MADRFDPQGPAPDGRDGGPLWRKLAWFAGLAAAGLLVTAGAAYALRALLLLG